MQTVPTKFFPLQTVYTQTIDGDLDDKFCIPTNRCFLTDRAPLGLHNKPSHDASRQDR